MAYNLTLTNGEPLVTISDATVDVNFTSLNLVGKNYPGYGQLINENFVRLLENFANAEEPANALVGQIWFDTNNQTVKIRTEYENWKTVGGAAAAGPTPPIGPGLGDFWWNTLKKQLFVWTGSAWRLIGPGDFEGTGTTGAVPDIIKDVAGNNHVIIKMYVNSIVTAIWSNEDEEFEVAEEYYIENFYEPDGVFKLKSGLTMAKMGNYDVTGYSGVDKNTIWGTAENALNLNGLNPGNFFRKDAAAGLQTVNNEVELKERIYVGDDILPLNTEEYDIGSSQSKFDKIFAKQLFANEVVADSLTGSAKIADSDSLPEGQINRYYTVARENFARDWPNITNKPNFALVATTGKYTDLLNLPDLSLVATTGKYGDLLEKPILFNESAAGNNTQIIFKNSLGKLDGSNNLTFSANTLATTGITINGNLKMNGGNTTGIFFRDNPAGGSGDTAYIKYYPYSGEKTVLEVAVSNDGIGTAQDSINLVSPGGVGVNVQSPSATLHVDGTILATGDITAFSDATLKTNIETIANPLDIVKKLRGVFFDRIDTGEASSGVLAQEVREHLPMLVKETKEGILSVNFNAFSGLFIEAIKTLENEIAQLKKRLDEK